MTDIVRRVGVTICPFEHITVLLVFSTKSKAVLLLLAFCLLEDFNASAISGNVRRLLAFLVLSLAITSVTLETVCRMVIVFLSKSMLSHCRPSSSLRRKPYNAVIFTIGKIGSSPKAKIGLSAAYRYRMCFHNERGAAVSQTDRDSMR